MSIFAIRPTSVVQVFLRTLDLGQAGVVTHLNNTGEGPLMIASALHLPV
jgi:hypothetical protein